MLVGVFSRIHLPGIILDLIHEIADNPDKPIGRLWQTFFNTSIIGVT